MDHTAVVMPTDQTEDPKLKEKDDNSHNNFFFFAKDNTYAQFRVIPEDKFYILTNVTHIN